MSSSTTTTTTSSTGDASDAGLIFVFGYVPSTHGAITFTAIYAVVCLLTFWQSNRVRSRGAGSPLASGCCCCCFACVPSLRRMPVWHFTVVLPITAVLELFGYGMRYDMVVDFGAWPFLLSQMSILIAPVILAMMNYKVATRLLAAADQKVGCCSPRVLSALFVVFDVICVIMQFAGTVCATLAFAMNSTLIRNVGNACLVSSFTVQLLLNAAFSSLIVWMYKQPRFSPKTSLIPNITKIWTALGCTVTLLWIRNIYRASEGFTVVSGKIGLSGGESLFFVLDSVPILLCVLCFCGLHYGLLLPPTREELADIVMGSTKPTSSATATAAYYHTSPIVVLPHV